MATYLILNASVILAVLLILKIRLRPPSFALKFTFALLVVLTAIFDNLIVGLSIVDYDPSKILGVRIGYAPIEDFMYVVLAIVIIPVVWDRIGDRNAKNNK